MCVCACLHRCTHVCPWMLGHLINICKLLAVLGDVAQCVEHLACTRHWVHFLHHINWTWWCVPVAPVLRRWRQENQEVEIILVYLVESRPAWDLWTPVTCKPWNLLVTPVPGDLLLSSGLVVTSCKFVHITVQGGKNTFICKIKINKYKLWFWYECVEYVGQTGNTAMLATWNPVMWTWAVFPFM